MAWLAYFLVAAGIFGQVVAWAICRLSRASFFGLFFVACFFRCQSRWLSVESGSNAAGQGMACCGGSGLARVLKPNKPVKATRRPVAGLKVKLKFKASHAAWLLLAAVALP